VIYKWVFEWDLPKARSTTRAIRVGTYAEARIQAQDDLFRVIGDWVEPDRSWPLPTIEEAQLWVDAAIEHFPILLKAHKFDRKPIARVDAGPDNSVEVLYNRRSGLRGFYRLVFMPNGMIADGRFWSVTVTGSEVSAFHFHNGNAR
jgi:hypothetical protein